MALRQKRKETATSHLRTRKQYEDLLKKRLNSLDTLRATLIRVEAAAGDVDVRHHTYCTIHLVLTTTTVDPQVLRVLYCNPPCYPCTPIP